MPSNHSADLLQPSLGEQAAPRRSPYSQQVHFLSAFFGGPFAALALAGINAVRLDRIARDAWWIALCALLYVGVEYWLLHGADAKAFTAWGAEHLGKRWLPYLIRALALAYFVIAVLMHRKEHKMTDLMGLARPSGWLLGIGLILGGWLASGVLVALLS
jgi:hypothetical protein